MSETNTAASTSSLIFDLRLEDLNSDNVINDVESKLISLQTLMNGALSKANDDDNESIWALALSDASKAANELLSSFQSIRDVVSNPEGFKSWSSQIYEMVEAGRNLERTYNQITGHGKAPVTGRTSTDANNRDALRLAAQVTNNAGTSAREYREVISKLDDNDRRVVDSFSKYGYRMMQESLRGVQRYGGYTEAVSGLMNNKNVTNMVSRIASSVSVELSDERMRNIIDASVRKTGVVRRDARFVPVGFEREARSAGNQLDLMLPEWQQAYQRPNFTSMTLTEFNQAYGHGNSWFVNRGKVDKKANPSDAANRGAYYKLVNEAFGKEENPFAQEILRQSGLVQFGRTGHVKTIRAGTAIPMQLMSNLARIALEQEHVVNAGAPIYYNDYTDKTTAQGRGSEKTSKGLEYMRRVMTILNDSGLIQNGQLIDTIDIGRVGGREGERLIFTRGTGEDKNKYTVSGAQGYRLDLRPRKVTDKDTGETKEITEDNRLQFVDYVYNGKNKAHPGQFQVRQRNLGVVPTYSVPNVLIDERGVPKSSNPNWRKENGIEKSEDKDEFLNQGYSPILGMMGFDRNENNTYGNGRSNDTSHRAIYDIPKMVKMSLAPMIRHDEHGMPIGTNDEMARKLIGYISEGLSYVPGTKDKPGVGKAEDYVFGWLKNGSASFIKKDIAESMAKRAQDLGISSPLSAFNAEGILNPDSLEDTIKQITAVSYLATPSIPLASLGYANWSADANNTAVRLVNEELLYKALGIGETDKDGHKQWFDSLSLFMPGYMGIEGQLRGPVSKLGAQIADWKQMLRKQYLVGKKVKNKETGEERWQPDKKLTFKSGATSQWALQSVAGNKYKFYVPGIGSEDVIERLATASGYDTSEDTQKGLGAFFAAIAPQFFSASGTGANAEKEIVINGKKIQGITQKDLALLRDEYMVDIMDEGAGNLVFRSSIKNRDKFTKVSTEDYVKLMTPQLRGKTIEDKKEIGRKALEAARAQGRVSQGSIEKGKEYVTLTNKEAQENYARALQLIGGYHLVKSEEDFDITRNDLAESLATAFDIPEREREESLRRINGRLAELGTDAGQIAFLRSKESYRQKLEADPNFYLTQEAQGLIENEKEALTRQKSSASLALIRGSLKNKFAIGLPSSILKMFAGRPENMPEDERALWEENELLDPGVAMTKDQSKIIRMLYSRMPAAAAEYIQKNIDPKAQRAMLDAWRQYTGGALRTNAIFASPEIMDTFNTGDFDGDTIWALELSQFGEEGAAAISNRVNFIRKKVGESAERLKRQQSAIAEQPKAKMDARINISSNKDKEERIFNGLTNEEATSLAGAIALSAYLEDSTTAPLGAGAKVLREAFNLSDDDSRKWDAIASAIEYYDKATSDMRKHGMVSQSTTSSFRRLLAGGTSFQRGLSLIDRIVGDTDNIEEVSKTANKEQMFKFDLPNLYNSAGIAALTSSATDSMMRGKSRWQDFEEYMAFAGFDPDSTEGKAARKYMTVMSDALEGIGLIDDSENGDIVQLERLLVQWRSELDSRADRPSKRGGYAGSDAWLAEEARYNMLQKRVEHMRDAGAPTISHINDLERAANADVMRELSYSDKATRERYKRIHEWAHLSVDGQAAFEEDERAKRQAEFEEMYTAPDRSKYESDEAYQKAVEDREAYARYGMVADRRDAYRRLQEIYGANGRSPEDMAAIEEYKAWRDRSNQRRDTSFRYATELYRRKVITAEGFRKLVEPERKNYGYSALTPWLNEDAYRAYSERIRGEKNPVSSAWDPFNGADVIITNAHGDRIDPDEKDIEKQVFHSVGGRDNVEAVLNSTNIEQAQREQIRRELFGDDTTLAMVFGSITHGAMENLGQRAMSNGGYFTPEIISDLRKQFLTMLQTVNDQDPNSAYNTYRKTLRNFGVVFSELDDEFKKITPDEISKLSEEEQALIKQVDDREIAKINRKYRSAFGRVEEDGTIVKSHLTDFLTGLMDRKERVVAVEDQFAFDPLQAGQRPTQARTPYVPVTIKDKEGKEHTLNWHIAHDMVTQDEEGKLHSYDYKSDKYGAYDTLYQSIMYSAMAHLAENADEQTREIFSHYFDNQGKSRFASVTGVDFQNGLLFRLNRYKDDRSENEAYAHIYESAERTIRDAMAKKYATWDEAAANLDEAISGNTDYKNIVISELIKAMGGKALNIDQANILSGAGTEKIKLITEPTLTVQQQATAAHPLIVNPSGQTILVPAAVDVPVATNQAQDKDAATRMTAQNQIQVQSEQVPAGGGSNGGGVPPRPPRTLGVSIGQTEYRLDDAMAMQVLKTGYEGYQAEKQKLNGISSNFSKILNARVGRFSGKTELEYLLDQAQQAQDNGAQQAKLASAYAQLMDEVSGGGTGLVNDFIDGSSSFDVVIKSIREEIANGAMARINNIQNSFLAARSGAKAPSILATIDNITGAAIGASKIAQSIKSVFGDKKTTGQLLFHTINPETGEDRTSLEDVFEGDLIYRTEKVGDKDVEVAYYTEGTGENRKEVRLAEGESSSVLQKGSRHLQYDEAKAEAERLQEMADTELDKAIQDYDHELEVKKASIVKMGEQKTLDNFLALNAASDENTLAISAIRSAIRKTEDEQGNVIEEQSSKHAKLTELLKKYTGDEAQPEIETIGQVIDKAKAEYNQDNLAKLRDQLERRVAGGLYSSEEIDKMYGGLGEIGFSEDQINELKKQAGTNEADTKYKKALEYVVKNTGSGIFSKLLKDKSESKEEEDRKKDAYLANIDSLIASGALKEEDRAKSIAAYDANQETNKLIKQANESMLAMISPVVDRSLENQLDAFINQAPDSFGESPLAKLPTAQELVDKYLESVTKAFDAIVKQNDEIIKEKGADSEEGKAAAKRIENAKEEYKKQTSAGAKKIVEDKINETYLDELSERYNNTYLIGLKSARVKDEQVIEDEARIKKNITQKTLKDFLLRDKVGWEYKRLGYSSYEEMYQDQAKRLGWNESGMLDENGNLRYGYRPDYLEVTDRFHQEREALHTKYFTKGGKLRAGMRNLNYYNELKKLDEQEQSELKKSKPIMQEDFSMMLFDTFGEQSGEKRDEINTLKARLLRASKYQKIRDLLDSDAFKKAFAGDELKEMHDKLESLIKNNGDNKDKFDALLMGGQDDEKRAFRSVAIQDYRATYYKDAAAKILAKQKAVEARATKIYNEQLDRLTEAAKGTAEDSPENQALKIFIGEEADRENRKKEEIEKISDKLKSEDTESALSKLYSGGSSRIRSAIDSDAALKKIIDDQEEEYYNRLKEAGISDSVINALKVDKQESEESKAYSSYIQELSGKAGLARFNATYGKNGIDFSDYFSETLGGKVLGADVMADRLEDDLAAEDILAQQISNLEKIRNNTKDKAKQTSLDAKIKELRDNTTTAHKNTIEDIKKQIAEDKELTDSLSAIALLSEDDISDLDKTLLAAESKRKQYQRDINRGKLKGKTKDAAEKLINGKYSASNIIKQYSADTIRSYSALDYQAGIYGGTKKFKDAYGAEKTYGEMLAQQYNRQFGFGHNAAMMFNRASRLGYGFMMVQSARESLENQINGINQALAKNEYEREQILKQGAGHNIEEKDLIAFSKMNAKEKDEFLRGINTPKTNEILSYLNDEQQAKFLNGEKVEYVDSSGKKQTARIERPSRAQQRIYNDYAQNGMDTLRLQSSLAPLQEQFGKNSGAKGFFRGLGLSAVSLGTQWMTQSMRKMFQSIKQEITQFSTEMSEIQGISLMSDAEMDTVKQSTIDKAKKLHVNISTVAQAESALYRQGLSQEEVESRTDTVVKLAKVAGMDVNTANKVTTMLVNTGLYDSAASAADAIAALGDAAATTGAELTKALLKTSVAASEYGINGGQLLSYLTAFIETTQLSGNIAGTGFMTVLNRLNKVASGDELIIDEQTGEATRTGTIGDALSAVGINLYDQDQEMKNPINILMELASGWDSYSDFQKQRITSAVGGTGRNATSFLEAMDVFGPEGIARYEELLETEQSSKGMLGQKYDVMTNNVAASIQDVQTEWKSIWTDDSAVSMLMGIEKIIKKIVQSLSALKSPVLALLAPLTVMAGLMMAINSGGNQALMWTGLGLAMTGGAIALTGGIINKINGDKSENKVDKELGSKYDDAAQAAYEKYEESTDLMDKLENTKLKFQDKKYDKMTIDEKLDAFAAIGDVLQYLGNADNAAAALDNFKKGIISLSDVLDIAAGNIEKEQQRLALEAIKKAESAIVANGEQKELEEKLSTETGSNRGWVQNSDGTWTRIMATSGGITTNRFDANTTSSARFSINPTTGKFTYTDENGRIVTTGLEEFSDYIRNDYSFRGYSRFNDSEGIVKSWFLPRTPLTYGEYIAQAGIVPGFISINNDYAKIVTNGAKGLSEHINYENLRQLFTDEETGWLYGPDAIDVFDNLGAELFNEGLKTNGGAQSLLNLAGYEEYVKLKNKNPKDAMEIIAEFASILDTLLGYSSEPRQGVIDIGSDTSFYQRNGKIVGVWKDGKIDFGKNIIRYPQKEGDQYFGIGGVLSEEEQRAIDSELNLQDFGEGLVDDVTVSAAEFEAMARIEKDEDMRQDVTAFANSVGLTYEKMRDYIIKKVKQPEYQKDGHMTENAIGNIVSGYSKEDYGAVTGDWAALFDYMYTDKNNNVYYSPDKTYSTMYDSNGKLLSEDEISALNLTDRDNQLRQTTTAGKPVHEGVQSYIGMSTEEDNGYRSVVGKLLAALEASKYNQNGEYIGANYDAFINNTPLDIPEYTNFLKKNKQFGVMIDAIASGSTQYSMKDLEDFLLQQYGQEEINSALQQIVQHTQDVEMRDLVGRIQKNEIFGGQNFDISDYEKVASYLDTTIENVMNNPELFGKIFTEKYGQAQDKLSNSILLTYGNYIQNGQKMAASKYLEQLTNYGVSFTDTNGNNLSLEQIIDEGIKPEDMIVDYAQVDFDELLKNRLEVNREQQTKNIGKLKTISEAQSFDEIESKLFDESFTSQYGALADIYAQGEGNFDALKTLAEYYRTGTMSTETKENLLDTFMPGFNELISGEGLYTEEGELSETGRQGLINSILGLKEHNPAIYEMMDNLVNLSSLLTALNGSAEQAEDGIDGFNDSMLESDAAEQFGEYANEASQYMHMFDKDARKAASATKSFNSSVRALQNNQWFRDQYRKGDKSDEVMTGIAKQLGYSAKEDLDSMTAEEIEKGLATSQAGDLAEYNDIANMMLLNVQDELQTAIKSGGLSIGGEPIDLNIADTFTVTAGDLSALSEQARSLGYSAIAEALAAVAGMSGEAPITLDLSSGGLKVGFGDIKTVKGGGGGGGGGKSAAAKLIEKLKHLITASNHQIKMIQAQETKYEQKGEYGNLNNMIKLENVAQEEYKSQLLDNIEKLKAQLGKTKKESDDWYDLRDAIYEAEESIEEANNAIDANNKKIKENQQAIYKTRTDLESSVVEAIDAAIQKEKDMLAGTISMEDTILDVIKQRYQEEFELIEKDIEKKKQALEEEKSLIDERLQMRKDAEDEARKYSDLAEYQRQYAQISMDPTRTKDATELLKKINDLQRELAWDTAEEEKDAQQDAIDDQIEAYDQFLTVGNEDLEALLKDANNFVTEVDSILELGFTDIQSWLSTNVEEFSFSLAEMQQQMLDNWEDTFRQMHGITGQYYEDLYGLDRTYKDLPSILETRDAYIDRMMQTDEYLNAISDEEKYQLIYGWEELYDNWLAAQPNDADYSHGDDWTDLGTNASSSSSSSSKPGPKTEKTQEETDPLAGKHGFSFSAYGVEYMKNKLATLEDAKTQAARAIDSAASKWAGENVATGLSDEMTKQVKADLRSTYKTVANRTLNVYKRGGLVDYTGPAWVDGSKTAPEAFLSSRDTSLLRAMLDAATKITSPYFMQVDPTMFEHSGTTVGDVNVTINEATINDDMDIRHLAEQIGEELVNNISKTGYNTGSFSF